MKIKFFAWLRDELGDEAEVMIESKVNVIKLKQILEEQLGKKFAILADKSILVAINCNFANDESIVNKDDEVAFFPPVTGG